MTENGKLDKVSKKSLEKRLEHEETAAVRSAAEKLLKKLSEGIS